MPDKLPHHAEPVRLDHFLHRGADIAQRRARLHRLGSPAQAKPSVTSSRRLGFGQQILPTGNRDRGVPVEPIDHHAAVDRNNVALAQHPLCRRNAVHYFLVHRRAQHTGITVISLERRHSRRGSAIFSPLPVSRSIVLAPRLHDARRTGSSTVAHDAVRCAASSRSPAASCNHNRHASASSSSNDACTIASNHSAVTLLNRQSPFTSSNRPRSR